jgi:hypothetical protein
MVDINQDIVFEEEHNEFINSELFCQMIKEKIEYSSYHKFDGIAPEGFTLVPNEVLEELKDFENWKEFKYDSEWIKKSSIKYLIV